jgi:predicted ester cyclase
MTVPEDNKLVVRRLIDEVLNGGRLDVIDELFTPGMAREAEKWIEPFRISFPDLHMEIVQLVAEADVVVGRFTCSATHVGEWRSKAATRRRFEDVDEVYFYRFENRRISQMWGIEDSLSRIRQLGLPR